MGKMIKYKKDEFCYRLFIYSSLSQFKSVGSEQHATLLTNITNLFLNKKALSALYIEELEYLKRGIRKGNDSKN